MDKRIESYIETEYTPIKTLKQTERSNVYLAKDTSEQIVVVKSVKTVGLPYQKLKEINHPLWPRILFTAEEDGVTWIVEEYVSGNTLAEEIEIGKRFTAAEVKSIMLELLDGMIAFHKAGIVHRDIKPSNVILQNKTHIRLIDFDVAREYQEQNSTDTQTFGTTGYAPPEQYGFAQTDERSDIYALGVTMREIWDNDKNSHLQKILNKCVELNPKDRYQSAEELQNALAKSRYRGKFIAICFAICVIVGTLSLLPTNPTEVQQEETGERIEKTSESVNKADEPILQKEDTAKSENTNPPLIPQTSEVTPIIPQEAQKQTTETKKLSAEDIRLNLSVNGQNLGAGGKYHITAPKSEWESWQTAKSQSIPTKFYPADFQISLTIENNSGTTIEEFSIQINREDEKIIRGNSIPPKTATTINIPMVGYKLKRNGDFFWLSFSVEKPRLKSQSFSYSVWIKPEE